MHVDLAGRMTYGDYLQLDTLLAAKKPLSDKHDEHPSENHADEHDNH